MTEQKEPIFLNGLIVKKPHEQAPDFIKCNLSFKVEEFIKSLEEHKKDDGWVNAQIKQSKGGKLYVALDTYVPKPRE